MDEDARESIVHLCTRIGMVMEGHVDLALTIRSQTPENFPQVLTELREAMLAIDEVIHAAMALLNSE